MNLGRKRGIVLVIVLGLVLLFVITATSFMFISNSEIKMARKQNDSTKAFYLAEAGLERAKYDLGEDSDWTDNDVNGISCGTPDPDDDDFYLLNYDQTTKTSLGGEFTVWLKNIASDEIWVRSKGAFNNSSRTIKIRLESLADAGDGGVNVTNAIEIEGDFIFNGEDYTINGDYEGGADISFEDIFGISKEEMKTIVQTHFPEQYYDVAFDGAGSPDTDTATQVTWVEAPATESQIAGSWTGDGILIVNGNLSMAGEAVFDGVIYVIGSLTMSGEPTVNGGIFAEGGSTIDTTISGGVTINYNPSGEVGDAFSYLSSLPPIIQSWQEVVAPE